jgi:hypothetical protein
MHFHADMMGDEPHDPLGVTRQPVSSSPPDSRSIQSLPSGLSISSTTLGSSR